MEPLLYSQGRRYILKVPKYVIIVSANMKARKEKAKQGNQTPIEDSIFVER